MPNTDDQAIQCPKCQSPYGYFDGTIFACPECFHEWNESEATSGEEVVEFKDSLGNPLQDGDSVITIKDLKAGNGTIKKGTKAKNIKLLTEPVNGHDISCKIDGHGSLYLKCSVVKKG